ncbi:MAG TPA: alpha/beta hydrolase [Noviherbaspirillum sp.]|nr:alpha/beta hydrolase [Noviherbaspirillum sp.]
MNDFAEHQISARRTASASRSGLSPSLIAAGAALAAAALFVRQRTRQAEREHPPTGHFLYVDGVRLHYVERGHGQPLVLLHGDGSMIQDFEISGLIDLAASKYRVIVFDRPGYGYSWRPRDRSWGPREQAALLHHALQLLDVEQPIVLGHSWGTLVALSLALEFPHYVKSLVLLSGYYYPTVRLDAPLLSSPAIPVIGDLMRYTVSPLIGRMIWPLLKRRIFSPAEVPERFSTEFPIWMALRPLHLRASAAEAALMIPSAFLLRKRYHELTVPTVIMAGDGDTYVNTHVHSEHLHRELPGSEYRSVPGAGHMVHHLAPQQVLAAIDRAAQVAEHSAGRNLAPGSRSEQFEYYGS